MRLLILMFLVVQCNSQPKTYTSEFYTCCNELICVRKDSKPIDEVSIVFFCPTHGTIRAKFQKSLDYDTIAIFTPIPEIIRKTYEI